MARHRRCLAAHQSILAPEHARILRAMRAEEAMAAEPDDDEGSLANTQNN